MGNDFHRIYHSTIFRRQRGSGQKLGTIRNDPLEHTGKNIQKRRAPAGIYPIFIADIFCHTAADNDRHRIVCRGTVRQGHERRDAQLGGFIPFDHFAQFGNKPFNTAIVSDHFRNTAAEKSKEKGFPHPYKAVPDILCESNNRKLRRCHADKSGKEYSCSEYEEYICPKERQSKNGNIRKYFKQAVIKLLQISCR